MTAVAWLKAHRTAAAVTAGLVVVAVVATVVTVAAAGKDPEDVVREYLDAIRAGDTETALAIAGEPNTSGKLAFLTADALADDWTVDRVVERHRHEDEVDVDVTLRAGEETEEGRFHLTASEDGWRMEAPFVEAELWVGDLDVVELGTVAKPVEGVKGNGAGTVRVVLFPGVYRPYASLADRFTTTPTTIMAVPQQKDTTLPVELEFALTKTGAANVNGAIARYVTDCAAKTGVEPDGCPFNAEPLQYRYAEVQNVTWSVVTLPEASFLKQRSPERAINPVLRRPGVVRMTVTGIAEDGAPPTTVTVDCEFGIDSLVITTTMERFTVRGSERPYVDTRCY